MNVRRLLALVLLLVLPVASAQSVDVPPLPARAAQAVTTWTEAEILSQFGPSMPGNISGGSIARALPSAGRFIRYGGGVVILGSLVYEALHWYYDEVNKEANDSLGIWWRNKSVAPFPPMTDSTMQRLGGNPANRQFVEFCYLDDGRGIVVEWDGQFWFGSIQDGYQFGDSTRPHCTPSPAKTLEQYNTLHPNTAGQITPKVAQYITSHPDAVRRYLTPAPNENQWRDDPYADPTLDTDGDGVPDSIEAATPGGDPNDPNKKPVGAPYEIKRETNVTRNPDGSITTTTKITYSDGKTATTSTTTSVSTTKNPDGSTTTRTTTTTTSTDTEGKTTSRTTTSETTTPGNGPAPLPVGSPSPYTGPSPNGDDDADGIPNDRDRSPYGPGGTPGAPVPSSPVDPSNSPKPGDPDYIPAPGTPDPTKDPTKDPTDPNKDPARCGLMGGVIDHGVCVPDPSKDPDKDPTACAFKGGVITDGKCVPDPSKDPDKDPAKCALLGGVITDGKCGPDPDKDKKECEKQEGKQWDATAGTCGGKKEDPPEEKCGNFQIKRFLVNPFGWLKDLIIPCESLGEIFKPLMDALHSKFPFSLADQLSGVFQTSGGDAGSSALPHSIGIVPVDFGWLAPLWGIVKSVVGVALWAWFFLWLIDRFTPQAGI